MLKLFFLAQGNVSQLNDAAPMDILFSINRGAQTSFFQKGDLKDHRRRYTEENKLCLEIGSSVVTESV